MAKMMKASTLYQGRSPGEKRDCVGKFLSRGPSPPTHPILGVCTFLPFFFIIFLLFYKAPELEKNEKNMSGFESDAPPPLFGNFPHIIPFFSRKASLMEWVYFRVFRQQLTGHLHRNFLKEQGSGEWAAFFGFWHPGSSVPHLSNCFSQMLWSARDQSISKLQQGIQYVL